MVMKRKTSLDPLNVAYGVGAAVVITGAMFKFLHWQYANEMLFVGLATEAIVFFISAFELKTTDVEYQWDKIFPQLTKEEETPIEQLDELIAKANLDPVIIEKLTFSITQLEENVRKMAEVSNTAELAEQMARMRQASERFEQEITRLNQSMADLNRQYDRMLDVMGAKKI